MQLSVKELHKHTMIEIIPFDLDHYLQTFKIEHRPTLLISYFDPKDLKSRPFILKNIEHILK